MHHHQFPAAAEPPYLYFVRLQKAVSDYKMFFYGLACGFTIS